MLGRFFGRVTAGVLLGFTLWGALVEWQLGAPTETSRWVAEMLARKERAARAIAVPKLVVTGGSNVLFGVRARTLSRLVGRPAVNMACQVGLDLPYILHQSRAVSQRGDTLLLALEYELYTQGDAPTRVAIDYVMSRDPSFLHTGLTPLERLRWTLAVPTERLQEGLRSRLREPAPVKGGYDPAAVDAWGDYRANDRPIAHQASFGPAAVLQGPSQVSPAARQRLAAFVAACQADGIAVRATYPSTCWFPVYANANAEQFLTEVAAMWAALGVPVLGEPRRFMAPEAQFFDTIYHLKAGPAEAHSIELAGLYGR